MQFKKSKALIIWPIITILVLLLLACLTQNKVYSGYNVLLNGPSNLKQAQIFIDNKLVGQFEENISNTNSLSGCVYWCRLNYGRHKLLVTKSGYKNFTRDFSFDDEIFIPVNMLTCSKD